MHLKVGSKLSHRRPLFYWIVMQITLKLWEPADDGVETGLELATLQHYLRSIGRKQWSEFYAKVGHADQTHAANFPLIGETQWNFTPATWKQRWKSRSFFRVDWSTFETAATTRAQSQLLSEIWLTERRPHKSGRKFRRVFPLKYAYKTGRARAPRGAEPDFHAIFIHGQVDVYSGFECWWNSKDGRRPGGQQAPLKAAAKRKREKENRD